MAERPSGAGYRRDRDVADGITRRAGYRAQAAETLARGGPERPTDEELGIIKANDTAGRIASDANEEIRSKLSRLMSRFGRRGKK